MQSIFEKILRDGERKGYFRLHNDGANIEYPIGDSPWGSYFGMFRDKFGIEWMVGFDPKHMDVV